MQPKNSLNFFQLSMVYMMSTGLLNHVTLIPILLEVAGRDSWTGPLGATGFTILWSVLLVFIIRQMQGKHLCDWLQQTVGRPVTYLLIAWMTVILFLPTAVTLIDLIYWTNNTYLTNTPRLILLIPILGLCLYNAYHGIYSVRKTASLLLPFVILFGIFVATANMSYKDYSMLLPVLEQGWHPVVRGTQYALSGFLEIIWIVLLQHRLDRSAPLFKGMTVITVLMFGLTVGPLIGAIVEFGPSVAANMRYPAFEEWRLVKIGDYIEHVDFLSIFQWITGAYVRLSLHVYLILELYRLHEQKKRKVRLWTLGILGAGLLMIFAVPLNDIQFIALLKTFVLPLKVYTMLVLSVILGVIALIAKRKEGREGDEGNEHPEAV